MPAKKPADPTWVKHNSKQGALTVPLLRREVARGEVVKVSRAQADRLTQQEMWTEVPAPAPDADNGENGD